MPKFIVTWNAGYGINAEIEEHKDQESAQKSAYAHWLEEAENNADYSAEPYSKDLAQDLDLEDVDED